MRALIAAAVLVSATAVPSYAYDINDTCHVPYAQGQISDEAFVACVQEQAIRNRLYDWEREKAIINLEAKVAKLERELIALRERH